MKRKLSISQPPPAHVATGEEIGVKVPKSIVLSNVHIEAGAMAVFNRRSRLQNNDIILFHHCGDYRIGMLEKTWPDLWNIYCPDYGLVPVRPHELRYLGVYSRSDEFFALDDFGAPLI